MKENNVAGVYFSDFTYLAGGETSISEIYDYAKNLPNVAIVWQKSDLDISDVDAIAEQIKKNGVKRIIIAGITPGVVKPIFSYANTLAGNSAKDIILASFKEYNVLKKQDIDFAKAVLLCAVYGVPIEVVADSLEEIPIKKDTLVIGGGVAGIQTSLEIADSGNKVFLVEKTGTIGGLMAKFDKTFPTLDCAACILTPKMVDVGQHPNIDIMTCSEIKEVLKVKEGYKVKVLKKARRVNLSTCTACGLCAEKCPTKVPNEFDENMAFRKAIYIPFAQAVPNKYLIDAENCRYIKTGKCQVCLKNCPVDGCINFDEKDEIVELTVGNIVVCTGLKTFDAKKIERYGYGKYLNVLTSIEFERLLNAAGPTGGVITYRTKDKKGNLVFDPNAGSPNSVAIIHCIGSRDKNYNKYCSKVCCMYSLKLAHLVKDKLPSADVYEYFIDMRAFGKNYEEFYERIKREGVHLIRGRTAKIEEEEGKLVLFSEDILRGELLKQKVDMVILSVGLEPSEDNRALSEILGIPIDEDGWFVEANYNSDDVDTPNWGISVAGVCQGPKDIPDTVAQASAAAARIIQNIAKNGIKRDIKDLSLKNFELKVNELSTL